MHARFALLHSFASTVAIAGLLTLPVVGVAELVFRAVLRVFDPALADIYPPGLQLTVMATSAIVALPVIAAFLFLIRHIDGLRARSQRKLRYDALTGVLSRAAFLDDVARRTGTRRWRVRGALLVIDADYFKQVNDRFGHAAGDAALKAIAQALRSRLRADDLIGRIGGEEFAVFLPGADAVGASRLADRLRTAVAELRPDGAFSGMRLTVSIGVVHFARRQEFGALFDLADRLLYAAKSRGRDCVEFAAV